jgi:hypothetical protein
MIMIMINDNIDSNNSDNIADSDDSNRRSKIYFSSPGQHGSKIDDVNFEPLYI